ncbi:AlkA N-terminal domain-containing protein [Nocardioides piscis]|uniref:DNA-3-methyladenine glycosylase II n=1 Tax=Nocardioides piscis TaxID=2714938 RepID=A0A6G7YJV3_9ACTN|nr:AlkA N-terminal domain-containing protein [Nocardioides piscis]QIK77015.1 DNA-3-methyladenine glycosylase 2 family protein [Nocardioides piscis]
MKRRDLDHESCYRAVQSMDRRFDGVFYTAVRTTGIYCRPSCPARTPAPGNVTFHRTTASAQAAGFRACKRCRPDATPGSPDWDVAADVAGRTMRLIADGVVDREGVGGLASRLGYTPRHLGRLLTQELGAGPLSLARAHRAQTARVLIETTDLAFTDVAFAAGFGSVRQFNETVREVYATSPSQLRGRRAGGAAAEGVIVVRLAVRAPYAGSVLLDFLRRRAVPGVELVDDTSYARTLMLPHGPATLRLTLPDVTEPSVTAFVRAELALSDLRDTSAAVERARRLLDADCDPVAVSDAFGADPVLGPLVRRTPGLRVPGHVDGNEVAIRAVLGQQVSVAGARTVAARLTHDHGAEVETGVPGLTHLFPDVAVLAALDPESLPMPRSRGRALTGLCAALADATIVLDRAADRDDVRHGLLALPGIGPWTADYISMRALGHPDVLLETDLGTRDALRRLGAPADLDTGAWRPWRSYAQAHLWHSLVHTQGDS